MNHNQSATMNIISRFLLKNTNRPLYNRIKLEEQNRKFITKADAVQIEFPVDGKSCYTFKHSGNSGDIIYSLPTLYALAGGVQADLYLNLDLPMIYSIVRGPHPLLNTMLNQNMFSMLRPLLLAQPEINRCEVYNGENIDYDLDIFRNSPFPSHAGNIARWYFLHFAVNADLGKPWLRVNANCDVSDCIVIARSQGYHSPGIDYSFLQKYGKLLFVGVPEEYEAMKKALPDLEYHQVADFLELAEIIAGCRLFIGNQSFPFSIAEALKVRRILEVCYHCPNVIVEGSNGYDFCFQPQFEIIVKKLAKE